MLLVATVLALSVGFASAAVDADEVKQLPGWNGSLPSKHYSGYLPLSGGAKHIHYYLQLSEGSPKNDPLTFWTNGGPGCTSLKGAFEELGQLVFNRDSVTPGSSEAPKLFYNPLGWTRISNLLVFEQPAGVGFSYCGNGNETCQNTDLSTADDNYEALVAFFGKFPEYEDNAFFITGESYAGMYIPTLMRNIDEDKLTAKINLVGAAIGNGVGGKDNATDGDHGRIRASFYYGKGLFSTELKETIMQECGSFSYPTGPGWVHQSKACSQALKQMNQEVGPHNFYNLADFCPAKEAYTMMEWEASMASLSDGSMPRMDMLLHENPTVGRNEVSCPKGACKADGDPPLGSAQQWCGVDRAMFAWLSVPAVQEALHVASPKGTEHNTMTYNKGVPQYSGGDLRWLYKKLALKYKLWIYNGQEDGCVPYNGGEEWTSHLGFPIKEAWKPWFGGDDAGGRRVAAGYVTTYGAPAMDFRFLTVKGSGHEVPTYKPAAAFALFSTFIKGAPAPRTPAELV